MRESVRVGPVLPSSYGHRITSQKVLVCNGPGHLGVLRPQCFIQKVATLLQPSVS